MQTNSTWCVVGVFSLPRGGSTARLKGGGHTSRWWGAQTTVLHNHIHCQCSPLSHKINVLLLLLLLLLRLCSV